MKTLVVWQKETKITYKRFSTVLLNYEHTDQIGKENGYGETVLIGFSMPFKNRTLKAIRDFFVGIRYGYPVCCIAEFAIDTMLDRPSAQLRWNDTTDHVPCVLHNRMHTKKAIPLDLY
jgi:hypothetical protein